jgi:ATP-dependent 26S proteasome regulatory subunit
LRDCFEMARRFAPSILVIEDVDTLPQLRDPALGNQVLGELMNQMDGLAGRDDVAVILTSNSWEFLEKAITERPGRIDQILMFEPPGREHRRVLLARLTEKLSREAALDRLVELTDGLTPAQIKELVKRAAVASLRRSGTAAWERAVTEADFDRSFQGLSSGPIARSHRPIGLRPMSAAAAK